MKRLLTTRLRRRPADHAYQVAALRMQLLVAMAAADGRVQPVEVGPIADGIDDVPLEPADAARLEQLLRILLEAPPQLEDVVERISDHAPRRSVAEALVRELVHVAAVDDHLDPREEALLRLVCGALGLEPSSVTGGRGRPLDARERTQLRELLEGIPAA